jgi:hypothetical protein
MDQPQQPRGNFVAFKNKSKQPGDRLPTFDGRLSIPEIEGEHSFALWAHEYTNPKTGEVQVMFNGKAGLFANNTPPMDQVLGLMKGDESPAAQAAGLTLESRQLVLFPNGFKSEAPEKNRPDYWGAFSPGNGAPVVRISVWMKNDRYGNAMMQGATSYPIPGKSEAEMQDAAPSLEAMLEEGTVSKGMPARKRAGGREAR